MNTTVADHSNPSLTHEARTDESGGHLSGDAFTISLFESDTKPRAVRRTLTWASFVEELRTPLPKETPKRELPMWSAATFEGDQRKGESIESVFALAFDIDQAPVPSVEELRKVLAGHRWLYHSSPSSTLALPRGRLVLPLSRPARNADEYKVAWAQVAAILLKFPVGAEAKDGSRAWYANRRGEDGTYVFEHGEGGCIDLDAYLALAPQVVPQAAASTVRVVAAQGDKRLAAAAMIGAVWPPDGSRYHAHLYLAGALVRGGWSDAEAVSFLEAVYKAAGADRHSDHAMCVSTSRATSKPKGFGALRKILDATIVDAARKLMGITEDTGGLESLGKSTEGVTSLAVEGAEANADDPLNVVVNGKLEKISFTWVVWFLSQHDAWRGVFRFNVLSRKHAAVKPPFPMRMEHGGYLSHGDIGHIKMWFASPPGCTGEDAGGYSVSSDMIKDAVAKICESKGRSYNPFVEYLNTLPKADLADLALSKVHATILGCADPMVSTFFTKALVAAVRRARAVPGIGGKPCPVDHQWVLVLVGEQDAGKGRLLKTLAGREFYHRMTGDLTDKDTIIKAQGKIIVELEELTSTKKADRDALKAFISADDDYERGAYERGAEQVQRSYVMFGTSNDPKFEDPTGNRRFVVVVLPKGRLVDIEAAERLRDRFWAEADALAATSYSHHLTAAEKKAAATAAEDFEGHDTVHDLVEDALRGRSHVTVLEIWKEITRGREGDIADPKVVRAIVDALGKHGCVAKKRSHVRGWDVPPHFSALPVSKAGEVYRRELVEASKAENTRLQTLQDRQTADEDAMRMKEQAERAKRD